jgi:hypothetical protein
MTATVAALRCCWRHCLTALFLLLPRTAPRQINSVDIQCCSTASSTRNCAEARYTLQAGSTMGTSQWFDQPCVTTRSQISVSNALCRRQLPTTLTQDVLVASGASSGAVAARGGASQGASVPTASRPLVQSVVSAIQPLASRRITYTAIMPAANSLAASNCRKTQGNCPPAPPPSPSAAPRYDCKTDRCTSRGRAAADVRHPLP